jgi:hypothetical protein
VEIDMYVDLMSMREGLLSPARWLSLRDVTPTDYARHVGEFLYDGVGVYLIQVMRDVNGSFRWNALGAAEGRLGYTKRGSSVARVLGDGGGRFYSLVLHA